jgi:hypothetical protein
MKRSAHDIALVETVRSIIDRHDPLRLLEMGAPPDEYDSLARAIVARQSRCVSAESCLEVVSDVFSEAFGAHGASRASYTDLAREIAGVIQR